MKIPEGWKIVNETENLVIFLHNNGISETQYGVYRGDKKSEKFLIEARSRFNNEDEFENTGLYSDQADFLLQVGREKGFDKPTECAPQE